MYKLKNGITLVGRYASEAIDGASSLADSIYMDLCDSFGKYALETFKSSPGISQYKKDASFWLNETASTKLAYPGGHPTKDFDWTGIAAAGGVVIAATLGVVALKELFGDPIQDAINLYIHETPAKAPAIVIAADSAPNMLSQEPVVGNASAVTATPTPLPPAVEKYVLQYQTPKGNMIKIESYNVEAIRDVVMSLEYGYEFSPVFDMNWTKEIENKPIWGADMAGGNGHVVVNSSAMREWIEMDGIEVVVRDVAHENWHNYLSLNDPKNNTEKNADIYRRQVRESLESVDKSEAKTFVENFDFSPWEKQIQKVVQ